MAKIEIVLDASKLRSLITNREYKKNGETVKVQEIKFELVEIKEPKTVVSGNWGEKKKTHFCAAIQTKEQKAAKEPTNYIGEGFITYFADKTQQSEPIAVVEPIADLNGDILPF